MDLRDADADASAFAGKNSRKGKLGQHALDTVLCGRRHRTVDPSPPCPASDVVSAPSSAILRPSHLNPDKLAPAPIPVPASSSAEPRVLGIVERLPTDRSPSAMTEDLDVELGSGCREVAADVGECHALIEGEAPASRGDQSDAPAVQHDRRAEGRVGIPRLVERERHEALGDTPVGLVDQGLPTGEGWLVDRNEAVQRGLEGRVPRLQVALPSAVALVQPEGLHRVEAEVAQAVGRSCR